MVGGAAQTGACMRGGAAILNWPSAARLLRRFWRPSAADRGPRRQCITTRAPGQRQQPVRPPPATRSSVPRAHRHRSPPAPPPCPSRQVRGPLWGVPRPAGPHRRTSALPSPLQLPNPLPAAPPQSTSVTTSTTPASGSWSASLSEQGRRPRRLPVRRRHAARPSDQPLPGPRRPCYSRPAASMVTWTAWSTSRVRPHAGPGAPAGRPDQPSVRACRPSTAAVPQSTLPSPALAAAAHATTPPHHPLPAPPANLSTRRRRPRRRRTCALLRPPSRPPPTF